VKELEKIIRYVRDISNNDYFSTITYQL